jgi:DNA modification methylase
MAAYEIITGNCIDAMEEMVGEGAKFDAIVTDPPYGIDYEYDGFIDDLTTLRNSAPHMLTLMHELAPMTAIFSGVTTVDVWQYPSWRLAWVRPAGTNRSKWGFSCWTPIAVYGDDPYLKAGKGARSDVFIDYRPKRPDGIDHPCVKPLTIMRWLIQRVCPDAKIILDPFCGTGTTGVACMEFGMNFVGIEINEKYAQIARGRLKEACRQATMF